MIFFFDQDLPEDSIDVASRKQAMTVGKSLFAR